MTRLLTFCAALMLCACDRPPPPEVPLPQASSIQIRAGLRVIAHPTLGQIWLIHPVATGATGSAPPEPSDEATAAIARRFGDDLAGRAAGLSHGIVRDAVFAGPAAPLVILTPGANLGGASYLRLAEALAARGYVVAVLHPHGSPGASETRYAAAAAEITAAIAYLTDSGAEWTDWIRPGPVGLVGHSLGGAASVLALASAPPGSVAVNLDGDYVGAAAAAAAGPVLYLIGVTEGEGERSRDRRREAWITVSGGASDSLALQLSDMRHFDATDLSLVSDAAPPERRHNRFGPAAPGRTLDRLNALTSAWLDRWLKGDATAWATARAADPGALEASVF